MSKALKVKRVSKRVYGAKITVKARYDVEVVMDSFLGERTFYLDEGDYLTIRVKGYDWREGDKISLTGLIHYAWEWADIPWEWT